MQCPSDIGCRTKIPWKKKTEVMRESEPKNKPIIIKTCHSDDNNIVDSKSHVLYFQTMNPDRRTYRCKVCGKKDRRGRLIAHILKHHVPMDRVPYACSLCNFRCMRSGDLSEHVYTYERHREEMKRLKVVDHTTVLHRSDRPVIMDSYMELADDSLILPDWLPPPAKRARSGLRPSASPRQPLINRQEPEGGVPYHNQLAPFVPPSTRMQGTAPSAVTTTHTSTAPTFETSAVTRPAATATPSVAPSADLLVAVPAPQVDDAPRAIIATEPSWEDQDHPVVYASASQHSYASASQHTATDYASASQHSTAVVPSVAAPIPRAIPFLPPVGHLSAHVPSSVVMRPSPARTLPAVAAAPILPNSSPASSIGGNASPGADTPVQDEVHQVALNGLDEPDSSLVQVVQSNAAALERMERLLQSVMGEVSALRRSLARKHPRT